MSRKAPVQRTPEENWEIVQEGIKSGNMAETYRRYGIAPNLYYRWKDEAQQGATAALGGKNAAAAESEKGRRGPSEIVAACGAKSAYGYRRVSRLGDLRRKEGLVVNCKRVLRVMLERGLLVRSRS